MLEIELLEVAEPVAILEVEPVAILELEEFPVEASPAASVRPDVDPREEIARIAYGYWQTRGCTGGNPLEDWVRAEHEYYAGRAV